MPYDGEWIYQPDHEGVADASEVVTPVRTDAVIGPVIAALVRQIQCLEDDAFDLATSLAFTDGVSDWALDIFGRIVEESRGTRTDDEFRTLIVQKLRALRSDGSARTIVDIVNAILNQGGVLYADGPGDANFTLTITQPITGLDANQIDAIRRLILLAKPAAVGLTAVGAGSNPFGFFGFPGALGFNAGTFTFLITTP